MMTHPSKNVQNILDGPLVVRAPVTRHYPVTKACVEIHTHQHVQQSPVAAVAIERPVESNLGHSAVLVGCISTLLVWTREAPAADAGVTPRLVRRVREVVVANFFTVRLAHAHPPSHSWDV